MKGFSLFGPKIPPHRLKPREIEQVVSDPLEVRHLASAEIFTAEQCHHNRTREARIARLRSRAKTMRQAARLLDRRADALAEENQAVRHG